MYIPELVAEYYKGGKFAFPDHNKDPELKNDPEFFLAVSRAILGQYFTDKGLFNYSDTTLNPSAVPSGTRTVDELRAYARGKVDPSKYFNRFSYDKGRKSYMNISWQPVGIISKFVRMIKGIGLGIDYDIDVRATDPASMLDKKIEKDYWKIRNSDEWAMMEQLAKKAGVNINDPKLANEAIEDLSEVGGIKMGYEIALTELINEIKSDSRFKYIKDMLIEDLATLNTAIAKRYSEGDKVLFRYVDPKYFVSNYSVYPDNRNLHVYGELRPMTVQELRRETNLTDTQIKSIIQSHMGKSGQYGSYTIAGLLSGWHSIDKADNMVVWVFDFGFISTDIEKYKADTYEDVPFSYEPADGEVLRKHRVEYEYYGMNVMGTDIVFNYGRNEKSVRKGDKGYKKAMPPYFIYNGQERSLVESCIPFEDDINIATFKQRDLIAKLPPPPGLGIEVGTLKNISIGGVKMTEKDSLDMLGTAGYLFYQSLDDMGVLRTGANSTPVKPLLDKSSFHEHAVMLRNEIAAGIDNIRQLTGINELVDSTVSDPRASIGIAKIALSSTNNALNPIFRGYENVFEQCMGGAVDIIQQITQTKELKVAYEGIGRANIQTLTLGKEIIGKSFKVYVDATPTEEERQQLRAELMAMRQKPLSEGGITQADYIMISRAITSGNYDYARLLLAKAEERNANRAREQQRETIELNGQTQVQTVMVAEEEKRKTLEFEFSLKMKEREIEDLYEKGQIVTKGQVEQEVNAYLLKLKAQLGQPLNKNQGKI